MAINYQAIPLNTAATLDIFPDEIIILILTQQILDLRSLKVLMSVSSRMRQLCNHVLKYNRLPAMQLSLTVDQEGKSKVTSKFEFSHFCPLSLNTLFTSNQPTARRYYTDKAYPVIRSMAIEDTCHVQSSSESVASSSATLVGSDSSSVAKQPSYTTTPFNSIPVYHLGNAKKLSAQKEGFHILQVSPRSTNHESSWKLAYRITDKHKPEYFLTPINITIGFEHLLKLDALNTDTNNNIERMHYAKTVNKMKNWVNRLF
ncbi:hypothetical protein INT46_002533 [Mucor plumbeus]|uniref:F-box domain-containing protein n=1 Tax=Mucor plumbeus TaxID=97098 RepID=A0A8H7V760_9FUNG|nr:hypothetical protein INT46_002533 [Mucor plumbeus]